MAANLVRAGFPIRVWNRTRSKTEPLQALGAMVAATAAEAARGSRAVVTMLWDGQAVDEVLFGGDGVVAGASPGTVIIDMSTTTPEHARSCASRLAEHGLEFLDCPVIGAQPRAEAGTLGVMVGGEAQMLEKVRDILTGMASTVDLVGPTGNGQLVKLANNLIGFGTLLAVAEGIALVDAAGGDIERALGIFLKGTGRSDVMAFYGPLITKGELHAAIGPRLALKDLTAARTAGDAFGSPMPVARTLIDLYQQLIAAGQSELGCQAIYPLLGPKAGRTTER
jgi:3-hydroxyisobutyrate dehydrogenase